MQTVIKQQRRICLERTTQTPASRLVCETLETKYSRLILTFSPPVNGISSKLIITTNIRFLTVPEKAPEMAESTGECVS